jgi:ankyrin repeat protein
VWLQNRELILKYVVNSQTVSCAIFQLGRTPLHAASEKGHVEVVEFLLHHDVDLNAHDEDGNCPLHTAAENQQTQVVQLLLDSGSQPDMENSVSGNVAITRILCRRASKSKAVPLCHVGAKGERKYSSYSFLASALYGVSGQRHAPDAFHLRNPLDKRLGGPQSWSGHRG